MVAAAAPATTARITNAEMISRTEKPLFVFRLFTIAQLVPKESEQLSNPEPARFGNTGNLEQAGKSGRK